MRSQQCATDPIPGKAARARVFIVDQDPNEVGLLAALLREEGYDVELATSARQAMHLLPEANPDLILIEIDLPDGDGEDLHRLLTAELGLGEVPVIFLGATGDLERRVRALEVGGVDFVARPFAQDELLARIKRHITVSQIRSALRESEAKFRSVTESAVDAIVSINGSGEVLAWNPAATRIFGYAESEMVGEPLDRIIPTRFRSAHHSGVARVATGGPSHILGSTVEVSALDAQGCELPVELSLASWTLDGERYFTGILRDISERKEAEARFRSVTDAAIDAIVSADHTGEIVGWNRAAEEIFGWSEEEARGQRLELIIPERFREAHRNGMDRMTRTGKAQVIGTTVELAGLRRDGQEIPIELSLSTWTVEQSRFYTGIIRDISKRKVAEDQLRRSTEELERQHAELKRQHEELQRSKEALAASFRQAQRLFSAVTDGMPGAILNEKYRLDEKIAAGGFGVVYKATQLALDRTVAVKVLRPPSQEDNDALLRRFRREGVSTCRVNHLNAIAVIDLDVSEGGFPYIVMEYIAGRTVAQLLDDAHPLPVDLALTIGADVAAMLSAAHRAGVIHRDIKPSNVLIQGCGAQGEGPLQGMVKVLDFGLARLLEEPEFANVTQTGLMAGTPAYMAPERLGYPGEEGACSDVYSLGVLLYECLGGQHPWAGDSDVLRIMQAKLNLQPPPLERFVQGLPEHLETLISRALERDFEARPTAEEMEATLRSLIGTGIVTTQHSHDETASQPGAEESWIAKKLQELPFSELLGD